MPPPFLPPSALNPWLIDVFRQLIIERTGLDIKTQNQAALCKTIMARTRATHQLIPENYYQLLMEPTPKGDREWQQLMVLLTNPESFFFRDKGQLGVLQQQILPELLQRHHLDKKLRICSAGCSTGEEPYSIAILLKELIPDLPEWDLIVFGVDINPVSIQKAQAGVYDPWSFRGVDESLWQTYFRRVNNQFHIDPQLKKLVKFKRLNLVSDPLMLQAGEQANATLDLIICRNVFIYF
ncbi:MAG: CheR family methyltransferase, partial [Cyanobacteria bacterium P01_D01_bin.44]